MRVRVMVVMVLSVRVVWGEVGKVELSVCWMYCVLPVGCTVHLMWLLLSSTSPN